jgi:hypothetical protein
MATIWKGGTSPVSLVRIASEPHGKTAPAPIKVAWRRVSNVFAASVMR